MSQWADDSMTPAPISVKRDKYFNEIPSDKPMHEDTTAGMGAFHYDGNQYATDFSSYGKGVDAGGASKTQVSVDVSRADRGKDA